MARLPRVIAVDTPHHVTQRGNARQFILDSDADRRVYWQLLQRYSRLHGLSLIGYCLMSNHVHLIVVPRSAESLATALKDAHGRYATYFNARHSSSGHVWQGRYFSCPLDPQHLWAALRYTELNPVRARLVAGPNDYQWSSAALHFGSGIAESEGAVDLKLWSATWNVPSWREYLTSGGDAEEAAAIRHSTHTGRPLGTMEFVIDLEKKLGRSLRPERGGRPSQHLLDPGQEVFAFDQF